MSLDEKLAAEIFARATLGMAAWASDGAVLACNEAFCRLVMRSEGEVRAEGYWAITADGQKQREINDVLTLEGRPYEKEFKLDAGRLLSVRATGFALQGAGEQARFAAVFEPLSQGSDASGQRSARVLRKQNALLLGLAKSEAIGTGKLDEALGQICEAAGAGLEVERASVWLYDEHRTKIVCLMLNELSTSKKSKGIELMAGDYPGYFAALAGDRTIAASDAHTHPATREFSAGYLTPLGISSMLEAPIRQRGKLVGVLCSEHVGARRGWTQEEQNFAASLADVVSLALEASHRKEAEEALLRANDELEARVEARTRELGVALDELWGEMALARRIQTALLPSSPRLAGLEIVASSTPALEVGGDYFDVIDEGGRGYLLVGDVSGHGVAAGLIMMMCQTAVRSVIACKPNIGPAELLVATNEVVTPNIARLGEDRYMTICALRHDGDGVFTYAGQHTELLVHRAATGQVEVLEGKGVWLGVSEDADGMFSTELFSLGPGDTLVLFSDGITEATSGGEQLGLAWLKAQVEELARLSLDELSRGILARLGQQVVGDDVTLVLVRRPPSGALRLSDTSTARDFAAGDLRISVIFTDDKVIACWSGRSTARDPNVVLGPFLSGIFETLTGRELELDFRDLAYMNSSTFMPIIRLVKRASQAKVPVSLRYKPDVAWQRAPFEMLAKLAGPGSTLRLLGE